MRRAAAPAAPYLPRHRPAAGYPVPVVPMPTPEPFVPPTPAPFVPPPRSALSRPATGGLPTYPATTPAGRVRRAVLMMMLYLLRTMPR